MANIINVDMINGFSFEEETPVVVVETSKPKMAIKNASKLSDEALLTKLREHKVEVPTESIGDRDALLKLAKENHLWEYSGNVVNSKYKQKYAENGGNCGDAIAKAFGPITDTPECDEMLRQVAIANGVDYGRWAHCNIGQKRMNLGNVLRGKIKRGENVIINHTEWDAVTEENAKEA